ncbi:hypothetical protein F5X98DRAFT_137837 [Xylaria grammica]|nr:hypothetical protein F5X98DRAFT_137837 [Xylaria grammica]
MASTLTTTLISDYSCDRKKQQTETPLLSYKHSSSEDSASEDSTDHTDRETINDAFQAIRASFFGLPTQEAYPAFHFENPSSFQSLQNLLEESVGLSQFVKDKVRLDWNPDTGDLLLRLMPTTVYEYFKVRVTRKIYKQLRRISQDPELAPICKQIFEGGEADIIKKGADEGANEFRKSPDGQFGFEGTKPPPFILEVAYSQKERQVLLKRNEYFRYFPGCTLLTFDLDYAPPEIRAADHVHSGAVSLASSTQVYIEEIHIQQ